MIRPCLAVGLALTLVACSSLPPLAGPDLTLPASYGSTTGEAGSPDHADPWTGRWWTLLNDAELAERVERALQHNRDLKRAIARIEEADAALRLAGAALLPQVTVDAANARNRVTEVGAVPLPSNAPIYRSDRKLALNTSYELDVWGRLRNSRESARAQMLANRETADTVALTVASTVAQTVIAIRSTDLALHLSDATISSREDTLRLIRIRRGEGIASELEERQGEAVLAGLRAQAEQLRLARDLLENQLGLLCGEPGAKLSRNPSLTLPEAPVPPTGLPSTLLASRPDIRAAEARMRAARLQVEAVRAAKFPLISLTGALGQQSGALGDLLTSPGRIWTLALGLSAPLLDFGRADARTDQARSQAIQAQLAYEQAVLTAFREVSDALASLDHTRHIEAALLAQRDASAAAARVSRVRYEGGYAGWLEVLDAERTANTAEQAWVQARQARLSATIDLIKALGSGWTTPANQTDAARTP